jgi:hypothetical protein
VTATDFGFDEFCKKWVDQPPAWGQTPEKPPWVSAATEDERCRAYMEHLRQAGGEHFFFSQEIQEELKRDVAAGLPISDILDRLLGKTEIADRDAVVVLFQRVFGIPLSRARYLSSWTPANRSREAEKVLGRVLFCIADARRAGLWSPAGEAA